MECRPLKSCPRFCLILYSKAAGEVGADVMQTRFSTNQTNPKRISGESNTRNSRAHSRLFVRLVTHGVPLQVVRAVAQPVVCGHLVQGAQRHRREGGVRHLKNRPECRSESRTRRRGEGRGKMIFRCWRMSTDMYPPKTGINFVRD